MSKKKTPVDGAWLSPKQALDIAKQSVGDIAALVIRNRLRAAQLAAHATFTSDSGEEGEPNITEEPMPIPAGYWSQIQDETVFWKAGDASFQFYNGLYGTRIVHCSGIRFLKKTIKRMFPANAKIDAADVLAPPPVSRPTDKSEDEIPKGRPISPEHLRLWYALYTSVFTDSEQNEDHARGSALGMFPGKSVTRAKIRELRGSGTLKRGRKSKEDRA